MKVILYLVLGLAGLFVVALVLVLAFFGLSYAAMNLFLSLDLSLLGQLRPGSWLGYALLGLCLGAAGGAVAAQRRFRLGRVVSGGAALLVLVLVALVVLGNKAHLAPPIAEAGFYVRAEGQGQCPACCTVAASSTKPDSVENRYVATKLLDKDPATAWISAAPASQTLTLALNLPTDQHLVGLRLTNGYGKSDEVFTSFSRVRTCHVRLDSGPEVYWNLPDTHAQDLFIPIEVAAGTTPHALVLTIVDTFSGENHAEVALSSLTPVIESGSR